ncbi:hypothetical protein [Pararhodospirillum oryzae]|nr:hypothetical protein [Pararhodospirillum oryzae]
MERFGGWFLSDEHQSGGAFSHCLMVNPYFRGEARVLLSLSLSADRQALLGVSDPAWAFGPSPLARGGTLAFDQKSPWGVRATVQGHVAQISLPPWPKVRPALLEAEILTMKVGDKTARFRLLDLEQALPALESCAATGKPPRREPAGSAR